MLQSQELYDLLGGIVTYPGEDYHKKVSHCIDLLQEEHPTNVEGFQPFVSEIEQKGVPAGNYPAREVPVALPRRS